MAVAVQQGHEKVVAAFRDDSSRKKGHLPALHVAAKKDDVQAATQLLRDDNDVDAPTKVSKKSQHNGYLH